MYWPPAVKLSEGEEMILHLSSLCLLEVIICSALGRDYLIQSSQEDILSNLGRNLGRKRFLFCAEFYSLRLKKVFMRYIANLISIQGVGKGRLKVGGGIVNGSGNFDMTYEQEPQTLFIWEQSVHMVTWRACFPI